MAESMSEEQRRKLDIATQYTAEVAVALSNDNSERAHLVIERRRDLDNYLKAAIDAGIGVMYEDDEQIDCLTVTREAIVAKGVCVFHVTEEQNASS